MKNSFLKYACVHGIVSILIFTSSYSVVLAKDQITWRVTNWPPVYILEGEYKGQGVADQILDVFEKEMPQYTHKRRKMNSKRAWKDIEDGRKVCHPSAFPNPKGEMSIMAYFVPPHQIVIRKDKVDLLQGQQIISLDKILSDKRFKTGVTYNHYGKVLNPIVNKHKGEIREIVKYDSRWKMLFVGRLDYIVEYPFIMKMVTKLEKKLKVPEIAFIQIKEVSAPYKVHVACPKNEWGKQVIKEINSLLLRVRNTPKFRGFMESWLDPENVTLLRDAYQKELGGL